MNKKELVQVISEKTGVNRETVSSVINDMHETIVRTLKKGDTVRIAGFGTFYPLERKPRKGRNPKTGEVIQIPARNVTRFRPGKNTKVLT